MESEVPPMLADMRKVWAGGFNAKKNSHKALVALLKENPGRFMTEMSRLEAAYQGRLKGGAGKAKNEQQEDVGDQEERVLDLIKRLRKEFDNEQGKARRGEGAALGGGDDESGIGGQSGGAGERPQVEF